MSRVFNASVLYNSTDNFGITAFPFTVFNYVKISTTGSSVTQWQFNNTGTNYSTGEVLGTEIARAKIDQTFVRNADTPAIAINTSTWYPVVAVFDSAYSSRIVAFGSDVTNGNSSTYQTNATPSITIGSKVPAAGSQDLDGKITHLTVWDKTLSEVDIAALIAGDDPSTIDSANQTRYWSFTDTSLTDSINSIVLTNNGTTTDADNPTLNSIAPVLTLPTATAISATALSGTVTTDGLGSGTLYWYVDADATPPTVADIKAGTGSVIFGNQAVTATGLQSVASMSPLSIGTGYYVHYVHTDANGDSNISTTTLTTTFTKAVTISAITGGENLNGLDYTVFAGQDLSTMTILLQGTGETTDASGDLTIDLTSTAAVNGDPLIVVIGDWVTTPTAASSAAVCYANAVA